MGESVRSMQNVNVIWRHVKGHAGDPGNEAMDILSKMATDRSTRNVKKKQREKRLHRKIRQQKGGGDIVDNQEPDGRTTGARRK